MAYKSQRIWYSIKKDILTQNLGLVDAERFISLMLREPFDYTEWQRELYQDVSLDDFYARVKKIHAIKTSGKTL